MSNLHRVVIASDNGTLSFLFSRVPCIGERIVVAINEDEPSEWEVVHVIHLPIPMDGDVGDDAVGEVRVTKPAHEIT
jgi:hypothetical protein